MKWRLCIAKVYALRLVAGLAGREFPHCVRGALTVNLMGTGFEIAEGQGKTVPCDRVPRL